MTWREKIVFLDAKRRLLAPWLRADSALNYEMMYAHVRSRIDAAVEPIPDSALLAMDGALERSIAEEIPEAEERAIRAELQRRFGLAALGPEPRAQLRRIARAGRIDHAEEAALVEQYLSGDFSGAFASETERARFSALARAYYERTR